MRAFYEKPDIIPQSLYAITYICDHPKYNSCTLYAHDGKGLAVIQQRYDKETKHTWWSDIDPWLVNDIYLSRRFKAIFNKEAKEPTADGLFPTIELRKMMYKVGLYPLHREPWES